MMPQAPAAALYRPGSEDWILAQRNSSYGRARHGATGTVPIRRRPIDTPRCRPRTGPSWVKGVFVYRRQVLER